MKKGWTHITMGVYCRTFEDDYHAHIFPCGDHYAWELFLEDASVSSGSSNTFAECETDLAMVLKLEMQEACGV